MPRIRSREMGRAMARRPAISTSRHPPGYAPWNNPMAWFQSLCCGLAAIRPRSVTDEQRVTIAGYAIVTQRPGTANGMLFQSLEDVTGIANVAVMPHLCRRFGPLLSSSRFLLIEGKMQSVDGSLTVRAEMIRPLNLTEVEMTGRSFR